MGLLSAFAGGVSSYAKGRVAELDQDREFNMKKELLDIAAEREAMIEQTKTELARKRGDAALGRVNEFMGPETQDVTIGDAKNESTIGGYTNEKGEFIATKANSPVTEQQPVSLGQRFSKGLLNAIKSGDSEAYATITAMYDNAQKLDKGEADIAKTQAETTAELKGKKTSLSAFAEKLTAINAAGMTPEKANKAFMATLGVDEDADDPYRETPEEKAAREKANDEADLTDEELRASVDDEYIKKYYKAWKTDPGNFQHNTVKDFLEATAPARTKEYIRKKRTAGITIPYKEGFHPLLNTQ